MAERTLAAPDEPAPGGAGGRAEIPGGTLVAPEEAPTTGGAAPTSPGGLVAGRYRLVRLLGSGGGGAVYEGLDTFLADPAAARVAVKRIPRSWAGQEGYARREVTSLRYLRLPGVVRLRDDGVDAGGWFIVMDLVEGAPLFDTRGGPLPWSAVEGPLAALLDTLSHVHAAGIVHRDLKPANVLLVDGAPVVIDFGIALGAALAPDVPRGEGTPGHMPPEQARGERCDARADLYAVAVMAWNALTGGCSVAAATLAVSDEATPVEATEVDAPPHVLAVLRRMLAPEPADRPASAEEVLLALGAPPLGRRLDGLLARVGGDCSEVALHELFHGPDAFLHLREDAATLLFARTGGERARVAEELERWIRRGLARLDGDRVRVERPALDRLAIDASGLRTDVEPAVVIADATARAAAYRREGRTALAAALVELALATARAAGDDAAETRLLHDLVELALAQESGIAVEEALYELGRAHAPGAVEGLVGLLRGWKAVQSGQHQLALDVLAAAPAPQDERLEIARRGVEAVARWSQGASAVEAYLTELATWAGAGSKLRRAKLDGWLGNLRYAQGRYQEAAALHLGSADLREHADERLSASYNAARALLEVPRLEEARALAERLGAEAAACRQVRYELLALCVVRQAGYRLETATEPLVALASVALGIGSTEAAVLALNEAAIAWRRGECQEAARLAHGAEERFQLAQADAGALLARALKAAALRARSPAEVAGILEEVRACPLPGVAIQVYGLLADAAPDPDPTWARELDQLLQRLPPVAFHRRREVLSASEAASKLPASR